MTVPINITNPSMVSTSIACKVNRFKKASPTKPPTAAKGTLNIMTIGYKNDSKSAAINR